MLNIVLAKKLIRMFQGINLQAKVYAAGAVVFCLVWFVALATAFGEV